MAFKQLDAAECLKLRSGVSGVVMILCQLRRIERQSAARTSCCGIADIRHGPRTAMSGFAFRQELRNQRSQRCVQHRPHSPAQHQTVRRSIGTCTASIQCHRSAESVFRLDDASRDRRRAMSSDSVLTSTEFSGNTHALSSGLMDNSSGTATRRVATA